MDEEKKSKRKATVGSEENRPSWNETKNGSRLTADSGTDGGGEGGTSGNWGGGATMGTEKRAQRDEEPKGRSGEAAPKERS